MSSVNNLTNYRLKSYFEKIKEHIEHGSIDKINTPELISIKNNYNQARHEIYHFYPAERNTIVVRDQNNLYTLSYDGISDMLRFRDGLGETGEIYIVGQDHLIKSASRFTKDWKNLKVHNNSFEFGKSGKFGAHKVRDYRNVEVISAFSAFKYDDLEFVLLAEIDLQEILTPLDSLLTQIALAGIVLSIISVGLALYTSRFFLQKMNRLQDQLTKHNTTTARQINYAQEEERERIAINLHDSVGQHLTALRFGISRYVLESKDEDLQKKLRDLAKQSERIIQEVRSISYDLMPSLIKDFGVVLAIKEHLSKNQEITSLKIDFNYPEEINLINFKKNFQINLYRIVQELLQNTIKHAKASSVQVDLSIRSNNLMIDYKDDGIGMSSEMAIPRTISYRTELFHGKIHLDRKNDGFKIMLTFNLRDLIYETDKNLSS